MQENLVRYSGYFDDEISKKLASAIVKGDEDGISKLVEQGADLQSVGKYSTTPLRVALYTRQPKIFEFLLKLGANPNFITPSGDTIARHAIDPADSDGYNKIYGDIYLELLLNYGLDPNLTPPSGAIILRTTTSTSDISKKYDLLVAKGADLSVREPYSKHGLGFSFAGTAQYERLKDLIERGVDVTEKYTDKEGLIKDHVVDILVDHQKRFSESPNHPAVKARAEILMLLKSKGVKIPEGVLGVVY
ncbi:MAG: hypothetical protein KBB54_01605 [Candidatus Pacebacteria bacterium]|nr:hypothetical protein [Candidatus Paceibacterota bacterium]